MDPNPDINIGPVNMYPPLHDVPTQSPGVNTRSPACGNNRLSHIETTGVKNASATTIYNPETTGVDNPETKGVETTGVEEHHTHKEHNNLDLNIDPEDDNQDRQNHDKTT